MDLQISVFILFILFTAGHSLRCYECMGLTGSCEGQTTCPSGSSQCSTTTTVAQNSLGGIISKATIKNCAAACPSWSMNFGITKTSTSCCSTDLCNAHDAPDPVLNGKKCFYCDDQSCSNILSCSGTEDRCIKATVAYGGQSAVVKGCASKSICDATASVNELLSLSCCEGNLCNGAQSVSQSFLFLCCSLLSYFLLH